MHMHLRTVMDLGLWRIHAHPQADMHLLEPLCTSAGRASAPDLRSSHARRIFTPVLPIR